MMTLKHVLETDVLVVGGGIGGLCAAISAAQGGARVTVLEKADSRRSGSGATGNDHFTCYYPEAHGNDIGVILKELLDSMLGLCHDTNLSVRFLERSIGIADKWHEWGINMKPFGDDYVFMGNTPSPTGRASSSSMTATTRSRHSPAQARGRGENWQPSSRCRTAPQRGRHYRRACPGHERKGAVLCRRPREKGHPRHRCGLTALPSGRKTPGGCSIRPSVRPARARRRPK